jgi:hypothetical protein
MERAKKSRRPVPSPALAASQIRAARALLGVSQLELADQLGVHLRTIAGWEIGEKRCSGKICTKVLAAFYDLGVIFPSGGAGIDGKYKYGSKQNPIGECAQLIQIIEPWTLLEVDPLIGLSR